MNNYCTNCGNKLNPNDKKCDKCNTYVVDLKTIKRKNIFKTICIIIGIVIACIILFIIIYNLYYKSLSNTYKNKYLKDDYPNAKFVDYSACYMCDGSCDGSCINSKKIVGCYKYYYKSDSSLDNYDITIYNNRGNISVDIYSAIINKYNFNEGNYDDEDIDYYTSKRDYITIYIDNIPNNIEQIYNMVNELFNAYKLDTSEDIEIVIYDHEYNTHISISNITLGPRTAIDWDFGNNSTAYDPTLDTIKDRLKSVDNYKEETTTEEETIEND